MTLCPGSGRSPLRVRRGSGYRLSAVSGLCPECGLAVDLTANPDGGPEGLVGDHGGSQ